MYKQVKFDIDDCVKSYFNDVKGYTPLKKQDERVLLEDYLVNGNKVSRDKLIKCNLKYASSIANSYRGKGVDYSELISEANDGLIEGIEKFDLSKDVKLITYAKWWIIQRIKMCISNRFKHTTSDLPSDHQEQVTDECDDHVETSINKDYETLVADEMDSDKNIEDKRILLNRLMENLSERERDIIELYYGINCKPRNLEDVGKIYGITKERTRQIIECAFKKVRTNALLIDEPLYF
jgi:RNA polymerase primary sigma factor